MNSSSEHWDSIFSSKDQDVSWWQGQDALWLDLIRPLLTHSQLHIADIGSGTSYLLETLARENFLNLTAVDISPTALMKLSQRAEEAGIKIATIATDIAHLQSTTPIDVWHDRAVFHFMNTPETQAEYKSALLRNLAKDGHVALATFSLNGPTQCSGLDVTQWSSEGLEEFFAPEFSAINAGQRDHSTPWDSIQNFTWIQLKRNA